MAARRTETGAHRRRHQEAHVDRHGGKNIMRIDYRDDDADRATASRRSSRSSSFRKASRPRRESRAAFDFIEKQTEEYHDKLTRTEEDLKMCGRRPSRRGAQ